MWDAPTRLIHWALVLLVAFSWWSAENRALSFDMMMYHRWSGYAVIGLLVFRIYWGLVGGSTARFSDFVKGPRAIREYLDGKARPALGHNPVGALSIIAMLLLLFAQVASGLFAVDIDGMESGPLSSFVDFDQGRVAAEVHELTFNLLLVLIALHVLAIAFYLVVKRNNLLGPMITGHKRFPPSVDLAGRFAPVWRILPGVAIAGLIVWVIMKGLKPFG